MFLSRGDRDLGVAFQTHPGRQAFISSGSKEARSALESPDSLHLRRAAGHHALDEPADVPAAHVVLGAPAALTLTPAAPAALALASTAPARSSRDGSLGSAR